jgi:hypothetical protein
MHLSLSSSRRSIRALSTVGQIPARAMPDIGQIGTSSNAIAAKAVSDQTLWPILKAAQQAFEEPLGRSAVPTVLHQDFEDDAMLVHHAPKIVQNIADADENLVDGPCVSRPRSSPTQVPLERGAKLPAPLADAFVSDRDAALGQDQVYIAQTEAEDFVEPDSMTDDLDREPMSSIEEGP